MKTLSRIVDKMQHYRSFRILVARSLPVLQKIKIKALLQIINKGSFSDSWGMDNRSDTHNRDLLKKYAVDFSRQVSMNKKYTIGFILKPTHRDTENIIHGCHAVGVSYVLYDIGNPDLFVELKKTICNALVICPAHDNNVIRNIFHETAQVINSEMNIFLYPSLRELNFYEAKRTLSYFLTLNNIPHPKTAVFNDLDAAVKYLNDSSYPLVFKTHLGASASGVEILPNRKQALKLARHLFNKYYLRKMETEKRATEWGYMLVQEFVNETKEYRIIKIGDSWFGYQKWKSSDQVFMSGSGVLKWIDPSVKLLNFCYEIASRHKFTSMCFDIFEDKSENFLVNELQTWFGSYDPTEMYVDGIPGRYCKIEGKWVFEPGMYNVHGSMALRVVDIIKSLQLNEPTQ
jgi:hypothetical protein